MAVGRVYDDGPDPDTVWAQDRDTWWAESRHEAEPDKITMPGGGRASAWDHITTSCDLGNDTLTFGAPR